MWREISKAIKTCGTAFVREKFATGKWGPDTRREDIDHFVGNQPRHRVRKHISSS
jgi:hypothetical protein